MKKNTKIIISVLLIILLGTVCFLVVNNINKKDNKPVKKKTTTTVSKESVKDKYSDLTYVKTTSIKADGYEMVIENGKLSGTFDGNKLTINGLEDNVKYITDLGNFISSESTFVIITDDNCVYAGEVQNEKEINFIKLKIDNKVTDLILVSEMDYSYGYINQAYALLDTGELKKIEHNSHLKKTTLGKSYENRDIDIFIPNNNSIVLRVDKSKDNTILTKIQKEGYDENHEMTVTIDFKNIKYNNKNVKAKSVILSDNGYKVFVLNDEDYILYAKQDKDISNENITELYEYNSKKVKSINKETDSLLVIEYMDGSKENINYNKLYNVD